MNDIFWDDNIRDLVFAPNGDFAVNENVSAQNGGILMEARAFNILKPSYGVGLNEQVMNGPRGYAVKQLNRWVQQVQQDGGQANWQTKNTPSSDLPFTASVSY